MEQDLVDNRGYEFFDLCQKAREYFNQGFNVVAIRLISLNGEIEKKPLTQWKEWIKRRQSEEEFTKQPWNQANGFAIVCSFPNAEGLYLGVVDFDVKKVSEEARRKGKELIKLFPKTRVEKTISGGLHLIYLCREEPKADNSMHKVTGLEVIAGQKLCIMAPSQGYEIVEDNEIVVVDSLNEIFDSIVKKRVEEDEDREEKEVLLEKIKQKLDVKSESSDWIYVHCPFHPPDNHPSFAISKRTFVAYDFHDNRAYPLKKLAKLLDVEAEEVKEKKKEKKKKRKMDYYKFAMEIKKMIPIKTDRRHEIAYRFNGRYWIDDVEAMLKEILVEEEKEDYMPYHLTRFYDIVKALTYVDEEHGLKEPEPRFINFKNGILDLETGKLLPHDPKFFFRNMIRVNYNPNADCPKFKAWLNEILPDEKDQALVQEMFGYCLYRGYPIHVIFFLVGKGANGKSTLIKTLVEILGKENVKNIPLERLFERFQTTELIGKLVNIVQEPKVQMLRDTSVLKALTGEDLISAEIKGKQGLINFVNYAKLIVVANELPKVEDPTEAWWRRAVVLEFDVTIPKERQIKNIERQWLDDENEKEGIVKWAVEGLMRVLKCGFTESEKTLRSKEEYRKWSNPIEYFLDNYCDFRRDAWITKRELYDAYKAICAEEGLRIESEERFASHVKKRPYVTSESRRISGRIVRVWIGVTLKEDVKKRLESIGEDVDVIQESQELDWSSFTNE